MYNLFDEKNIDFLNQECKNILDDKNIDTNIKRIILNLNTTLLQLLVEINMKKMKDIM